MPASKQEASDWSELSDMASEMADYAMDHLREDGTVEEGSIYAGVYPLLMQLIDEADKLTGWNYRHLTRRERNSND